MKRLWGKVGLLAIAAAVGAAQLGWSQQVAPGEKPPAHTQPPAADANSLTVDVVGKLFSEDQSNLQDYWPSLEQKTKDTWLAAMPPIAQPPQSMGGTVSILCVVHTDGSVSGMSLEEKSGKVALDRAAWAAIRRSAPFDAFPSGISTDKVKVRFTFSYNGGIPVAPAVDGVKKKPGS